MITRRPLRYDDLWAVRAIARATVFELWPEDLATAYLSAACSDRALLRRLEMSRAAVAWDRDVPCGLVEAVRRRSGFELTCLQVVPAYRRQRIASGLLAWEGLPRVLAVRVERDNAGAAACLLRCGFHPAGEEWQPFGGVPLDRYVRTVGAGRSWARR